MSDKSKIEWTDATWNPLRGCTKVSEGCRNCYAAGVAARFSGPGMAYEGLAKQTSHGPEWTSKIMLVPEVLEQPLKWKRPRRIFVNSMSDLFHEKVPFDYIDKVFGAMALAPQHTFQILTKRPERMFEYLTRADCDEIIGFSAHELYEELGKDDYRFVSGLITRPGTISTVSLQEHPYAWPLPNVWLGVSVENQQAADERIPLLLQTPAAVRFLSCEPLLGEVDLGAVPGSYQIDHPNNEGYGISAIDGLDWVIVGGESGPKARPMHPDWAMSLRDQCVSAGVAFHFKQWGEWLPNAQEYGANPGNYDYEDRHTLIGEVPMARAGKKSAGRLLDGRTWDEFPNPHM